ncbi:MAG: GAF domain-containing protein [Spirochaetales bacterium]|nr:MAG: GAF domain-containing protein [Spirochaetales bacterium]
MKTAVQDPLHFLGESFTFQSSREQTLKNLRLIIRIRWFISPGIFIIMFIAGLAGFSQQSFLSENQLTVNGINLLIILILNVLYMVLVRKVVNLKPLVFLQLLIDVFHFTLTIYKTGTLTSPFKFLYFLVIFSAAIIVSGRASFVIAGICTVLYSLIILGEQLFIIPHQEFFSPFEGVQQSSSYVVLSWTFALASVFIFAGLASYLAGLLHKRQQKLEESNSVLNRKNNTMLLLYNTSKALRSYRKVQEVADYILSQLLYHLQLDRAILYINVRNEHLHLYMVKRHERDGEEAAGVDSAGLNIDIPLRADAGLTARCGLYQEAYNITDPENSPYINRELAVKIGLNPFAMAPIVLWERLVGVIGIDRSMKNGSITEDEFQILQMFANQAAITITNLESVDLKYRTQLGI